MRIPSLSPYFSARAASLPVVCAAAMALCNPLSAFAQAAPAPAPAPSQPATPAPAESAPQLTPQKEQEYIRRHQEGQKLMKEGKYAEARAIFEGILAEQPNARGSLFFGGVACLFTGDNAKAVEYLEKYRTLVPVDPRALVHLIQANQALKKNLKVEALRRDLFAMRKKILSDNPNRDQWDLGKPQIQVLLDPMYVRERLRMQGGVTMEISEAFNYYDSPNALFMAQIFGKDGAIMRNIYVSFDPDQTAALRKQHAGEDKYKKVEVFLYTEIFVKNNETDRIEIYRMEPEIPNYEGARRWLMDMLAHPPKPIMTITGDSLRAAAERNRPAPAPGTAPAPTPGTQSPSGNSSIAVPQDAPNVAPAPAPRTTTPAPRTTTPTSTTKPAGTSTPSDSPSAPGTRRPTTTKKTTTQ